MSRHSPSRTDTVSKHPETSTPAKIRADKWLWAARFYKTRSLASDAIKGGKVSINEQRIKPSRDLQVGDIVSLRQGFEQKTVTVLQLSAQRGPAAVAQQLYRETEQSLASREQEKELRQLAASQRPRGQGRPTKRERRHIHRFTQE